MSFQTPLTIEDMLRSIHEHKYLMPAIQREFVWNSDQIVRLVDSLMRGYPIGTFLLWKVEPKTAKDYLFYNFLTDYNELSEPFAKKATLPAGSSTIAVLDGQQRLTALNVALYGSFAKKTKHKRSGRTDSYPKKKLYLNLVDAPADEELGTKYDLRFLTEDDASRGKDPIDKWFLLNKVLFLDDAGPAMLKELTERGISGSPGFDVAYRRLNELYQAVRGVRQMNYFLVEDQDSDKVLDMFVRVNSGGTPLSHSDLLLSMATNQWREHDAREEIRSLVKELNEGSGAQFRFSKDDVLKAALTIVDAPIGFRLSSFTRANMESIENSWTSIRAALIRSVALLRDFGYSGPNLTASVIIPIAYYLHKRSVTDSYLDSIAEAEDRKKIRRWVTRSMLKKGIWGTGLDTMLGRIRSVLRENTEPRFPLEAIEAAMKSEGKSLVFDESEIDELLKRKYGDSRSFSTLAILYPHVDLSKQLHVDHIFPRSRFAEKALKNSGYSSGQVIAYMERFNELPNLQLMSGTGNVEKQAELPDSWIPRAYPDLADRDAYLRNNDLDALPLAMDDFLEFFESRKLKMRSRLLEVLGKDVSSPSDHS